MTEVGSLTRLVDQLRRLPGIGQKGAQRLAFQSFDDEAISPFDRLSSRELQIALMVVNCQRVNDISSNLHLSPKTVNAYRYRIFEKLHVASDVELALLAVKHGMINPVLSAG